MWWPRRVCRLGERVAQFVPARPIAGAENNGAAPAKPDLYRERKVVLTLPREFGAQRGARTFGLEWCGAQIFELTPAEHDRVFAAVSHLPHLLSFALVNDLAVRENSDLFFTFAASGFRDFTRIAATTRKCGATSVRQSRGLAGRA